MMDIVRTCDGDMILGRGPEGYTKQQEQGTHTHSALHGQQHKGQKHRSKKKRKISNKDREPKMFL